MTQKKSNLVISIGGPGGSGSTTIAWMISEHFNLKYIYAGDLFRKEANKEDVENFEQFLQEISKGGNSLDLEIDSMLAEYAKEGNILIESKIFGALAKEKKLRCDISIWLDASLPVRIKRHLGRESVKGFKKVIRYIQIRSDLRERYRIDREKYWRLYKIKYDKHSLYYDIVIDSSNIDEKETFNLILKKIEDGGYIK